MEKILLYGCILDRLVLVEVVEFAFVGADLLFNMFMRLMVELPPEDVDIESFQQSKKLEKIADQEQVLVEEDVLNLVKFDNRLYGVVVKVGKIQGVDVHLGLRVDD